MRGSGRAPPQPGDSVHPSLLGCFWQITLRPVPPPPRPAPQAPLRPHLPPITFLGPVLPRKEKVQLQSSRDLARDEQRLLTQQVHELER